MTHEPSQPRWFAALALASVWTCFLSLALKYNLILPLAGVCYLSLRRAGRLREVMQMPGFVPALALWCLLLLSLAWTVAPSEDYGSHLWQYALPLGLPLIALACPRELAARALRHFAAASAIVGVLLLVFHHFHWSMGTLGRQTIDGMGNQRIATSILLALGAACSVCQAVSPETTQRRQRLAWWAAALLAVLGLAAQDRRSGMVALPVLLVVLALAPRRGPARKAPALLALVAIVAAALLAGWLSDGVRGRFAEGLHELQTYQSSNDVDTSWGQRLRMIELTSVMIRDSPLLGHGVGSWKTLWDQAIHGAPALKDHTTPHNEYLLVTTQVGVVGLGLLVWMLAAQLAQAWRDGPAGHQALMIWTLITWTGLFNVVLRDSKFSVPLLLLAAFASAAARPRACPGASLSRNIMSDPHTLMDKNMKSLADDYEKTAKAFYAYLPDNVREIFIGDALYHKARYVELLERRYGSRVLELGSDKPFISHFLRVIHPASAFDTVSMDIPFSPYPIVRTDIESEPFPYEANAFSDVIFTEVLEHLFRNPAWTVCEINRVLKVDGRLFLTTPNACGYDSLINLINQGNPNARSQFYASIESGHPHLWTADECQELLQAHGFAIDRIDSVDYVPIPWPPEVRHFLDKHASNPALHGQSLRIEARKTSDVAMPVYPARLFPEGKPVQLQGALREWAASQLTPKN